MAESQQSVSPVPSAPIIDVQGLFSLHGRTAIVTGGTGGLGMAMTTGLASAGGGQRGDAAVAGGVGLARVMGCDGQ